MQHKTPAYISTESIGMFWTRVRLRINRLPSSTPADVLNRTSQMSVEYSLLPETGALLQVVNLQAVPVNRRVSVAPYKCSSERLMLHSSSLG